MSKAVLIKANYEELVDSYIEAKQEACNALLNLANTISLALNNLGERQWKQWLKDSRINLNQTQAYKFVAVSKFHKNNLQLTEGLNNLNIEKAYLLTRIKESERQEEVAPQIIEADFTVKETKTVVKLINDNVPTEEALKQAKEVINSRKKITPEKVPKEEYDKLKIEYETLLAKYNNLLKQNSNSQSKEPEATDSPDGTLDKEKRLFAYKGYWLPISDFMNINTNNLEYLKPDAISNAKRLYNLDLEPHPPIIEEEFEMGHTETNTSANTLGLLEGAW